MLTFISSVTPSHEKAGRILSENSGAFNLEDVSLVRKYMRSLLFSMECISTLFYGDILSMNPLELVVEIGITFWSIYIFGALVGAQSELLDAHGKRKADFEQGLGEMQLYLEQNAVPKDIKRQVKTYYARLWRRRKGESDFAAVEKASRRLYEDVVLATLHNFAAQVKVFRPMDDQFLRALLACLHYVVCSEKEDVFVVGDVDRSMYFIATGRIAVKMGSSEITRGHGEFFGELALLYGISRLETCVALTVTELYRLDHEPYEHLLLEFPEYRTRNKLAWTTFSSASARDRALVEEALRCFRRARPTKNKVNAFFAEGTTLDGNSVPSILDLQDIAANAGRIDAQLPHSYIYQSAMELFAKLGKLDPVEAKDMFLKIRDGARRQLKVALGVGTARDDTPHSHDAVHSFHSRSATPRNDNEDLSNNVEGLEAVTALSRPNEEQKRTEAMKSLPRSPNTDSKFR
ncbi:Potassium voltage-gated channel sub H member 5 [Phytophthora boehmeriae]|uniref:Potassium voltage-gated channel sub H member 5 n=1 Tax=Phytophthora boehmeriae TaxID=109152 RepID=A0A8T1WVI5_9STRA|nr:Potassium voltage-gated channel sub H member 5 [Phytophthora boehmeriae]